MTDMTKEKPSVQLCYNLVVYAALSSKKTEGKQYADFRLLLTQVFDEEDVLRVEAIFKLEPLEYARAAALNRFPLRSAT